MMKLARYMKRYAAIIAVAIVLLFGQAMLDLNLPNMMSNIVNVGIQKGGIEEVAPKAVSPGMMGVLQLFMSEDDFYTLHEAYTPYAELDTTRRAEVDKTFPGAAAQNAFVLATASPEADSAFSRSGYAFVIFLTEAAKDAGVDVDQSSQTSADLDLSALEQLLPTLSMVPEDQLAAVIENAAATPEMLMASVAAMLNKAMYRQLGADTDKMQSNYILRIGLIMVGLSLAMVVCAVAAGWCFARLGAGISRDLRRDIFAKVSGFSNAEMDKFSTSSLITRTTNDVNQLQMLYSMGLRMMVFSPIMGIGGIIMALRKSPGMSWIMGLAVAVIMIVIIILIRVAMPRFKLMQKLTDRLNMVARENLSGIMVVRAFSNQEFQEKRFDDANRDLTKNSLFIGRAMNILMPVIMLVMNGTSLLIVWLGAKQISESAIQVGDMMAFIQYAMQVIMSFLFIAMIFMIVPRASVSAERINEVLQSESTIKDPQSPKTLGKDAFGKITFDQVSFGYPGAEEPVLHNVSFTARPGETTAFIGSTGSGKSTLVNLIPRFYDVTGGSITLDGIDVRELTQEELRSNIGYVPQKGLLFSGDIAQNLRYGDENASDETLRDAAEIAQATEFIDQLDEGFHSSISQGGTNVSGGQRQRLSIARALVKKAPVYIFDDSFSALDFTTDAKLRVALKPYTEKSTVLLVAQRIASIMTAEQIVVLDAGRVVGIGTHKQLLQSCPTYREIAESQLSKEELA